MLRSNLPRAVRHLRRRRGWRQADLAQRAAVSRQVVSRIECGHLAGVRIRTVVRTLEALEATGELVVRWRGEQLDRLMDADHATLVRTTVELLDSLGWQVRVEVSFNHYGDRGRVDVLGLHPATATMLVVEVKSVIGDVQDTIGRLDVKARLAAILASSVGWPAPRTVTRALVLGDLRATRRLVATHEAVFASFRPRGRQAVAWLRHPAPSAPVGLLWFTKLTRAHGVGATRRVRERTVQDGR
jgi:transcriptional regulator with XRE-family HTH domain